MCSLDVKNKKQKKNANHILVWYKKFGTSTICISILVLRKKLGPAQTVLEPVEVQCTDCTWVRMYIN